MVWVGTVGVECFGACKIGVTAIFNRGGRDKFISGICSDVGTAAFVVAAGAATVGADGIFCAGGYAAGTPGASVARAVVWFPGEFVMSRLGIDILRMRGRNSRYNTYIMTNTAITMDM